MTGGIAVGCWGGILSSELAPTRTTSALVFAVLLVIIAAFGAFLGFLGSLGLAFGNRGTEFANHDVDRSHRVVISGDWNVREIGVAIGIDETDGRDAEVPSFEEGVLLSVHVDHNHGAGKIVHGPNAIQVSEDLLLLSEKLGFHLLRVAADLARLNQLLQLYEPLQAFADGSEVGQGAAEPSFRHVGHANVGAVLLDASLRLALGSHEDDVLAFRGDLLDQLAGEEKTLNGLLDVDDVDLVPGGEDVRSHLRIPVTSTLAEVDAGFDEFFDD